MILVPLLRQVDDALRSRRLPPAWGGVGLAQVDQFRGAAPLHRDRLAARGEVNSVRRPLGMSPEGRFWVTVDKWTHCFKSSTIGPSVCNGFGRIKGANRRPA